MIKRWIKKYITKELLIEILYIWALLEDNELNRERVGTVASWLRVPSEEVK